MSNHWQRGLLLPLLLLALGLRFYQLDAQSFWNDEGNSARLSERTIPLIIEGTASDIHPPLYYLLLRGWRELLGEHEFGLRSLSAFAGVLTVALTLALARRVSGSGMVGGLAGLLAAVNPALVYYSQETRMYALLALLSVLSTWLLWLWLMRRSWGAAIGYVAAATAGLYTHYFFPAVLLLHNVFVVVRWFAPSLALSHAGGGKLAPVRKTVLAWVGMQTAVFLLYLPWLPIFLRQAGGRPAVRAPLLNFLRDGLNWLAFGHTYSAAGWLLGLLGLLLLTALLGQRPRRWLLPLLGTLLPLLFMYAVGTTQPAFFKFMGTAVPFLCIWLALGIHSSPPSLSASSHVRLRPMFYLLALLLLVAVGNGRSLYNLYRDPAYARADYRGMAQRIAADNHPNAGIILDAPNQWEVFTYYHQAGAPVYPLPRGAAQRAGLEAELAEIAASHERIYALFWGEDQRDPERIVESWLDAHAFKATNEWVGDVRFVVYALPSQPAQTMQTAVSAQFGDAIRLHGYTIPRTTLLPGDIVEVTLFWETAVSLDQRYKVFLHLLDASGQLVAQRDSEPGGGLNPTTAWPAGETIRDNHGLLLPATLPAGSYQLLLGLYDSNDPNQRLPLYPSDLPDNALLLLPLVVRESQPPATE